MLDREHITHLHAHRNELTNIYIGAIHFFFFNKIKTITTNTATPKKKKTLLAYIKLVQIFINSI